MYPRPIALGLTLCDNAIIERDTNKVSLIGQFRELRYPEFPATALPFYVAATLGDASGRGTMHVEILDLTTLEPVFAIDRPISLKSRLNEYHLLVRVQHCVFPSPGWYNCLLWVADDLIAQRRFRAVIAE